MFRLWIQWCCEGEDVGWVLHIGLGFVRYTISSKQAVAMVRVAVFAGILDGEFAALQVLIYGVAQFAWTTIEIFQCGKEV